MSAASQEFSGPRPPGWTVAEERHAARIAALTDDVIDGKRPESDLLADLVERCDMETAKAVGYAELLLHFRRKVRGL